MGAHDDDVTCGASLTLQAGLYEKVDVHLGISANGCMGYCRPEHKTTIAAIREKEAKESYGFLGMKPENLNFLGFDDCSFYLNPDIPSYRPSAYHERNDDFHFPRPGKHLAGTWQAD